MYIYPLNLELKKNKKLKIVSNCDESRYEILVASIFDLQINSILSN